MAHNMKITVEDNLHAGTATNADLTRYDSHGMTTYTLDKEKLIGLKDKTILIVGAVSGIGRVALQIAHGMSLRCLQYIADALELLKS